jgi:hypothetical protein
LRLTHTPTFAIAFGAEPQAIAITANPATAIDAHTIAAFDRLPLELVEQDVEAHCPVVHRVTLYVRERGLSGLLRHGWNERRQLPWLLGRVSLRTTGRRLFLLVAGVRVGLRKRCGIRRQQEASDDCDNSEVPPTHSSTRTSRNMPASM